MYTTKLCVQVLQQSLVFNYMFTHNSVWALFLLTLFNLGSDNVKQSTDKALYCCTQRHNSTRRRVELCRCLALHVQSLRQYIHIIYNKHECINNNFPYLHTQVL